MACAFDGIDKATIPALRGRSIKSIAPKRLPRATIRAFSSCCWSDGRKLTRKEKQRLVAMRNNPRTRLPEMLIETDEQWWLRVRGVLEGRFFDPRAQMGHSGPGGK